MDVAFSFPLYISDNDKKTGDSTEVSNNLYIRGVVSAERQRASMPLSTQQQYETHRRNTGTLIGFGFLCWV
jgi:hypothetical protein